MWKGLVLQTRTWKWTAVIVFAIGCISNSSSNSNNSSNNVIIAINHSSGINNSASQRKKDRHWSKVERWREVDRLIKCCDWMRKREKEMSSKKKEAQIVTSLCSLLCTTSQIKLVLVLHRFTHCFQVPWLPSQRPISDTECTDFTCSGWNSPVPRCQFKNIPDLKKIKSTFPVTESERLGSREVGGEVSLQSM